MVKIFAVLAALLLAGQTFALELVLNNGTVLRRVFITGIRNDGIRIEARQPGMGDIFRTVRFRDMTPASRRMLFNYIDDMRRSIIPWSVGTGENAPQLFSVPEPPSQLQAGMLSPLMQSAGGMMNSSSMMSSVILPGMPRSIMFHSVRILQNGTLGWAESNTFGYGAQPTQYGMIYVYNVYMPQGNIWTGTVYPTVRTIYHRGSYYPCYATSPEDVRKLDGTPE